MVEKLELPFPLLSDPDRSQAIEPYGVADPKDERNIARPAVVVLSPSGEEVFRFVSRDFADRIPEDELIEVLDGAGLPATTQEPPAPGNPQPGPKAMPLHGLPFYFRGARFAALAMGVRHRHLGAEIKEDSLAYIAEMDRYMEAVQQLIAGKER